MHCDSDLGEFVGRPVSQVSPPSVSYGAPNVSFGDSLPYGAPPAVNMSPPANGKDLGYSTQSRTHVHTHTRLKRTCHAPLRES